MVLLLFDEAEEYMNYGYDDMCVYRISYDPTYAFVSCAKCIVYPHQAGLLGPKFSGHYFGISVDTFQVLDE